MSDEQVIQEAAQATGNAYRSCHAAMNQDGCHAAVARALHAAGLLRNGLEQRAIAACEAFAAKYLPMSREFVLDKDVWMQVHNVGRESLAAKQPKPRWTTQDDRLLDNGKHEAILPNSASAQACAALLNALAAESPR